MNSEDQKQDITIQFLKEQFAEIKELSKNHASKEDIARQQGMIDNHCSRLRIQENNATAAKEILTNTNDLVRKLAEQLDYLSKNYMTRQQLDRMIEVNQFEIAEQRKKLRELEIKQATSWTKLSIIWAGITLLGVAALNYIIEIFKKKIGG